MNRCLVIATVAEGGFYNDFPSGRSASRAFDLIKVNFNPDGFDKSNLLDADRPWYQEDVGFKHHIYKRLIENLDILDQYDWIWMPDYDVHLDVQEIERLFKISQSYNLNICQPSLAHDSYRSFDLVLNNPGKFMRYTNYVEVMCPLFKVDALRKVLWTFTVTYSGWAQDFLWARELNYERLAIIDDVQARHVKPVESQHWQLPNGLNADKELEMAVKLFGLDRTMYWPREIGGIDRWT